VSFPRVLGQLPIYYNHEPTGRPCDPTSKIVHLLDGCTGLRQFGTRRAELVEVFKRQGDDMARYVGEFTEPMQLRAVLVDRVIDRPEVADHIEGDR
jgi:hypothetical protein